MQSTAVKRLDLWIRARNWNHSRRFVESVWKFACLHFHTGCRSLQINIFQFWCTSMLPLNFSNNSHRFFESVWKFAAQLPKFRISDQSIVISVYTVQCSEQSWSVGAAETGVLWLCTRCTCDGGCWASLRNIATYLKLFFGGVSFVKM